MSTSDPLIIKYFAKNGYPTNQLDNNNSDITETETKVKFFFNYFF